MTIGRRVVAGYAGILLLVVAMMIVGVVLLVPLRKDIQDYGDLVLAQADVAGRIALTAKAMGTNGAVGVIGSKSESSQAVSQLEVKRRETLAALDEAAALAERVPASDQSRNLAEIEKLRTLVDQYDAGIMHALSLRVTNPEGARTLLADEVFPQGEELDVAAASYYKGEQSQALAEAGRLATHANTMWIALCSMAGVVIVGGVMFGVGIPRTVNRHLRAAVSGIDRSAVQMLAIASQVAAGAAQTAAATNETTATVEEVRQTALLSQEKATQLAKNSDHVARIAESGRAQAQGTITAYGRIKSQMDVVAQAIDRLSDQTQAVSEIIATVSDLAEQSNLLSVNASIEAAKAGAQGRGFAVVAQEVKNLAEQSKRAVAQVGTILNEIQKAGTMAVRAAEQGRDTIEAGRIEVGQAEEGTLSLSEAASEAALSAVQISTSSRQQLAGMDQISQAIGSIRVAGNQSAQGTRQVEEEARALQELALRLRRLVRLDQGKKGTDSQAESREQAEVPSHPVPTDGLAESQ